MKYFCILFLLLFLNSCKRNEYSAVNVDILKIDLDNKDLYDNSPAFREFHYVKLETTDNSLLGDISKVVFNDSRIYITSFREPTVFIFTDKGKFISKLRIGQGPGEILYVSDMAVHNNKLYVLDMYKTIKEYDLDGTYIKDAYKFDSNYYSFEFIPRGLLLIDGNLDKRSNYNVYLLSDNGEKKAFLKKKEEFEKLTVSTHRILHGSYLSWPLSDIIYHVDFEDKEVIPVYFIDFLGKSINSRKFDKVLTSKNVWNNGDFAWLIQNFIHLDNGFFFNFKYNKDILYVRRKEGEVKIHKKLLRDMPSLSAPIGSVANTLVFELKSHSLVEYKEKQTPNLPIFEEDIEETDNPILIFIPIKFDTH